MIYPGRDPDIPTIIAHIRQETAVNSYRAVPRVLPGTVLMTLPSLTPTTWLAWLLVPLMALGGVSAHFCGCGTVGETQEADVSGAQEIDSCCTQSDLTEFTNSAQSSCCKSKHSCPLGEPDGEQPDHCKCLAIGCQPSSEPAATSPPIQVPVTLESTFEDPLSMLSPRPIVLATHFERRGPKRPPQEPLFVAFCCFRC